MPTREKFFGDVNLSALHNETIIHKGKKGIFLPIEDNPSLIVLMNEEKGSKKIKLEIEVVPTPNSKYSDYMVVANVNKENREKFGLQWNTEQMNAARPILGNIKKFVFQDNTPAPATEPEPDMPDMPEEFMNSDQNW